MKTVYEEGLFKPSWNLFKYENVKAYEEGIPYVISVFAPNLILNEGGAEALDLLIGGSATAFSNANSYLAVGDDNTAEDATQTGLIAATNKVYMPMVATYPQRSGQTVTWQALADGNTANFAWKEFSLANGNSNSAKNLNRKVSDQGSKTNGQIWTLELQLTAS